MNLPPVEKLDDQVYLVYLSRLSGGRTAVLSRVSELPGVYAWYRDYTRSLDSEDPQALQAYLVGLVEAPHCATRSAHLAPSHRVTLSAEQGLPARKGQGLEHYLQHRWFRELLRKVMRISLTFQEPLYIGKASSLRTRIESHLSRSSCLRLRLSEAGIDIDQSVLLYMITQEDRDREETGYSLSTNTDVGPEEAEYDGPTTSVERVVEDLLSRLFHPSFTIRYG